MQFHIINIVATLIIINTIVTCHGAETKDHSLTPAMNTAPTINWDELHKKIVFTVPLNRPHRSAGSTFFSHTTFDSIMPPIIETLPTKDEETCYKFLDSLPKTVTRSLDRYHAYLAITALYTAKKGPDNTYTQLLQTTTRSLFPHIKFSDEEEQATKLSELEEMFKNANEAFSKAKVETKTKQDNVT